MNDHARKIARLEMDLEALRAQVMAARRSPNVPSDAAPNLVLEIADTAHGFGPGDVLAWSGTAWGLAVASSVTATEMLGCVGKVIDDDNYLLVIWGVLCLDDLDENTDYWLDTTIPGGLTSTMPTTDARMVLHHATDSLCVMRSGGSGGGELDAIAGTSVLGNATGTNAVPTAIQAGADNLALQRLSGSLTWAQVSWANISSKPTTLAGFGITDGIRTLTVLSDNTTATDQTPIAAAGTATDAQILFYEKAPRFSAKWLRGKELATGVGTVDGTTDPSTFLWWDKTNLKWSTFKYWNSLTDGLINVCNTAKTDAEGKMESVNAGLARSVFGRAAGSDGMPAPIVGAAGKVLQCKADGTIDWQFTLVLGTSSNNGHVQGVRGANTFDYCHVNTITTSTTVPTGGGVKGQMHMIVY